MNRALLALLLAGPQAQPPATPPVVHIQGTVLDSVSGKPLAGASLSTSAIYGPADPNSVGPPPVLRPSIRATSDNNGKFVLDIPEAGPHTIFARNNNYESWQIILSADEETRGGDVVIRLIPFPAPGVVSGRVIDASGRPVARSNVELLAYRRTSQVSLGAYSDHPELSAVASRETNDRGEFRLFDISPGQYLLRVPPPAASDGTLPTMGAVFYPGVSGLTKASKFEVRPGDEVRLGDLVLAPAAMQPIRLQTIDFTTGKVLSARPQPSLFGGPFMDLLSATSGVVDGTPAIRPDEPGHYKVCTSMVFLVETPVRVAHGQNACADVEYSGNAQEITLTLKKAEGYLTGRVHLEPSDGAGPLAGVQIGGVGVGPGTNYGATSKADGSFKSLLPVQDGRILLRFLDAPDGYYITSIAQGLRDALREGVIVEGTDTNLDVRVTKGTGILRGRIVDGDGKHIDHAFAVVIPEGQLALRPDKETTHRTSRTNRDGTFEIRNLIPGSYRAYAFATIEEGAYLDSQFFKPFEEQGTLLEIAKNATLSIELHPIPPRE